MTVTWSLAQLFSRANRLAPPDAELERWRTLLHWAAQTRHYWRQSEALADAAVAGSAVALRARLQALAPVDLHWLLQNALSFRSGSPRGPAPQRCSSFWDTKARVGLVYPWFRTEEPARCFAGGRPLAKTVKAINRADVEVLVASPATLLKLVRMPVETPRRALIAIHTPGSAMLREPERELLWQRFKVPLYQQLRGFQGELLASECDAQVGFHADQATAHWESRRGELVFTSLVNLRHPVIRLGSGWHGDLETSRCGCGCLSPRLFPFERQPYSRRVGQAARQMLSA